jgi:hypothetical protein
MPEDGVWGWYLFVAFEEPEKKGGRPREIAMGCVPAKDKGHAQTQATMEVKEKEFVQDRLRVIVRPF